ncbi:hypothetical protein FA048_02935 [Pedobacter polaris]|uniref:Uncharacterized protein n=1 Tax=Pedobacter polaris TaxID=2571273 RepID=A0A4U1CYU4_9SPHI|nr:hypothetical protein [Pedobacter polaris]TKC12588.1 hypothetical protein FA048_02935 [Pedobacter polaris]
MKKRKVIIISFIAIIAISIAYDNLYVKGMIAGKYIYNFSGDQLEGPDKGDHLVLKMNGLFESDTWGKGIYKLTGSRIELNYADEFGDGIYVFTISRRFFWGKPRLVVNKDLGYYFEKTN